MRAHARPDAQPLLPPPPSRQADWALTTPLLLIDLGLLAGVPMLTIGWIVFCDILMIAAGFAGAISTATGAVWPLFVRCARARQRAASAAAPRDSHHKLSSLPAQVFGMVAYLPIVHALLVTFKESAATKGPLTAALYNKLALLLIVTWTAYPLIWATGEGGQIASADQETIAYAAMDITCVIRSARAPRDRASRSRPRPPFLTSPQRQVRLRLHPDLRPRRDRRRGGGEGGQAHGRRAHDCGLNGPAALRRPV